MKPRKAEQIPQADLFRLRLDQMLNQRHVLYSAVIDALSLVETLPQSAGTVYGFAGSPIALPQISDQLAVNDPDCPIKKTVPSFADTATSIAANRITMPVL